MEGVGEAVRVKSSKDVRERWGNQMDAISNETTGWGPTPTAEPGDEPPGQPAVQNVTLTLRDTRRHHLKQDQSANWRFHYTA